MALNVHAFGSFRDIANAKIVYATRRVGDHGYELISGPQSGPQTVAHDT